MRTAEADGSPAEGRSYRPWLQRRIDASTRSPRSAGLGIAAALLGGFFAWHTLGWALGVGDPRDHFFWQDRKSVV